MDVINTPKSDLEVMGVSRSGRIRKKSSKLMDFQSPDEIDSRAKRGILNKSANTEHNTSETKKDPHDCADLMSDSDMDAPDLITDNMDSIDSDLDSDDSNPDIANSTKYVDSAPRRSIYMTEKSTKKKMLKDGKIVMGKAQRKDKGKSRFTAYMLWAKEARQDMQYSHPELAISKRLGEMWANVPSNEKLNWKRRAKRYAANRKDTDKHMVSSNVGSKGNISTKFLNKGGVAKSKKAVHHADSASTATTTRDKHSPNSILKSPNSTAQGIYKVNGSQPADVAAHLKLLGDSLTIIGERLKEHEGQITVSGSLSVLLDSLLCSLGPLMCLTYQIPGFGHQVTHLKETLHETLDNIAYVMPGL